MVLEERNQTHIILHTVYKSVSKTKTLIFGKIPRGDYFVIYEYYDKEKQVGASTRQRFDDKEQAYERYENLASWMAFRLYGDETRRLYLETGMAPQWENDDEEV